MTYTSEFPIFAVTVDIVAFALVDRELQTLLIQRSGDPFAGSWAFPGGFVEAGEDLETAARRELAEETGLDGVVLEQLATYGDPGRDPRPERVVSVAHLAVLPEAVATRSGSDAADAAWRAVAGLRDLAFDHDRILIDAVERLRSKLEYTALAVSFLGDTFTLAELRSVYESVWGIELDPGNFQRKMTQGCTDFVIATDDHRPAVGRGRPARLFTALKAGTTPLDSPIVRAGL